jgi:branched-chain amino acid transport system substrate-binding protein
MVFGRQGSGRVAALLLAALLAAPALAAEKKYGPGVSDTEIRIGNTSPYSGPASAFSMVAKTEEAYFRMINAEGGINGRRIVFVSYDDGYSPAKTVEQTRRLVESDEVLLVFNALGTAANSAVQKYLNGRKVPQLFVSSGAAKWNDPKNYPWDDGIHPELRDRGLYLRQTCASRAARGEDRDPVPERRFWKGLPQGNQAGPRRKQCLDDRRRRGLRCLRANDRLPSG